MEYQTTPTYHNKYFYWSPRLLALLGILLFSILSLDVFGEYSGWELAIAFFMHMIPTFIMVIGLAIAWKNELYGAIIYNFLGIVTIFFFSTYQELIGLLTITMPFFLVGELFFYNWYKEESRFKE